MRLNIQIERDGNRNYVKINTDDYEKIENALNEVLNVRTGGFGYDPSDSHRLRKELERLFENHSHFYSYIGFEGGTEHGPTGKSFDTNGFGKFLSEMTGKNRLKYVKDEDDLQLFCNAIADRLAEVIEEYDDELEDEQYVAKSSVSIDAEPSGRLTDPEMLDESLMVTDDGVKKLRVSTVEDAEDLSDIQDRMTENTKNAYETQVDARIGTLKDRVEKLKSKLEDERRNMLIKGIQLVGDLDNWKVEGNYLKYTETVHLETVQKKSNNKNPVELTEEAKEKFYIDGIKVRIRDNLRRPKYDDAYHPHALGRGTCTGSFSDEMSKEGLQNLVDQFKQADLHNSNHTEAERDLKENLEEYTKTDEDGEPVETELWEA